jgi:peptidyl-prolyl cis-trans isomerase A (cyclophilin A)
MARRRKIGAMTDSEAECYYCEAVIPANAMRCPKCGKFFSSAKKLIAFSVALIVVVASLSFLVYVKFIGGQQEGGNGLDPDPGPSGTNRFVNIQTEIGTIKMEMYEDKAPVTAGHFINLINNGYFNDKAFLYRNEPGFVIQGGIKAPQDPSPTTAPNVPWEDTGLLNNKYTVSMARSGQQSDQASSGTGSSEFFINLNDNAGLDSQYAYVVFGKVVGVSSENVVNQVTGYATIPQGGINYISEPIEFQSVTVTDT